MKVFIDSNILYDDPFFKSIPSKILLKAVNDGAISICISSVVLEESKKNYIELLEQSKIDFQKTCSALNKLGVKKDGFIPLADPEFIWDTFYSELINHNKIIKLQYDNNWLPELVRRAIYRIKPFKKNGQEFRDCLIWLTYSNFVNSDKDNCSYSLITNNITDFTDDKDKNCLHEQLQKDVKKNVKIYNSIKHFLNSESENIGDYSDYELGEKIKEKISPQTLLDIIEDQFIDNVVVLCNDFCECIDEVDIDDDDYFSYPGYFDFDCILSLDVENNYDVEAFDGEAQVEGNLHVNFSAERNIYNSMRDPGEDRYLSGGSREFNIKCSFTLVFNDKINPISFNVER